MIKWSSIELLFTPVRDLAWDLSFKVNFKLLYVSEMPVCFSVSVFNDRKLLFKDMNIINERI